MSGSPAERLVAAVRSGKATEPVRSAAARGALPLGAPELALLQVLLLEDESESIRGEARASLERLDEAAATALVEDEAAPREVLDYLAGCLQRLPGIAAPLARRRDLPAAAALALAAGADAAALEALVANQSLIAEEREIGDRLRSNEALPKAALHKLLDFLDELDKVSGRGAGVAAGEAGPGPASDPFLAALGVDAEVEAMLPELGLDLGELGDKSELLAEEDDGATYQRLSRLNVGQKLRVALFGTKEERTILVRDTNRVVAATVVKSPKFTEQEADAVSKSRNVNEEVLRLIARHREFASSYTIQRNLVCNPRTPFELSNRMITRLHDRDLKLIHKNRNLSDGVRRQAKKLLLVRESRRRVRVGGGRR